MNLQPTPPTSQPHALRPSALEQREQRELPRLVTEFPTPVAIPSMPAQEVASPRWRVWQWACDNTFLPSWLPAPLRHPVAGFVLAAVLEAIASVATLLLAAAVPTFSFFGTVHILVVALIALTFGAAPSLLAAFVGAAALELVVLPATEGGLAHPIDLVETLVFLTVGAVIAVISSNTERARRRAVGDYAAVRAREIALAETNARTDEFLSIASHELRSPLTSLKAALQLGQRRLRRMDEQFHEDTELLRQTSGLRELLTLAEQQVDRQDRLVGDLLDVSRIRANKLEFHLALCDLAAIVGDTVDEQRLSWPDRVIDFEAPQEQVSIDADAHRIGQVVTNFLTNALKYSPPDARVAVSLRTEGGRAHVAVRDKGPGLTAEQQAHIWDRFHRVPGVKQQSGTGAGLGLGLHIARTIIEYHGGTVGIDSVPRQGSTFWFDLPARPLSTSA